MNDQYLWDKTGNVDPEVGRLEEALQPLRHRGAPLDLTGATRHRPRGSAWRRVGWLVGLATAAGVVLATWLAWPRATADATAWTMGSAEGPVTIGSRAADAVTAVVPGDVIETGAGARVQLRAAGVGTLSLGPGTRLRVDHLGATGHGFALDRGSLEADISAPPGVFTVETPHARAIDLGCRYTLEVAADGSGRLHVLLGWVGLKRGDLESLVPAGAMCRMLAGGGPGTPYFEGASPAFVAALAALDEGEAARGRDPLATVLADARPIDAITLWHLLTRLDRASATRVFDRLAAMVPPPPRVTLDASLGADPAARSAWWDAIGLGDLAELRTGMGRAGSRGGSAR